MRNNRIAIAKSAINSIISTVSNTDWIGVIEFFDIARYVKNPSLVRGS